MIEIIFLTLIIGFAFIGLFIKPSEISRLKSAALVISLSLFFESLAVFEGYNPLEDQFIYTGEIPLLPMFNLYFVYGVDSLSLSFLILTTFIFVLCFMVNLNIIKSPKNFVLCLLAIEAFSILSFVALDLLFFYVFFESILIPMFVLIGIWGARERKIKAAYYFFLYTFFGSLFMLFGILNIYSICQTTRYDIIISTNFSFEDQLVLWICFFIAFSVKIPSFPFHVWLPEAHVEAPTVGSVILASLLLKLGGYGFLRYVIPILDEATHFFKPIVYLTAVVSIIYASLATLCQIDLKKIIAYSSVAHMNVVVLGLFSNIQQGVDGAIYLMIGHGIVSGALFFCVGVLYDRYHTRLLKYYSGLAIVMPLFASIFFIFTLANMGFPGTSNFVGELLIFIGLGQTNTMVLILAALGIVLSAVYSIWLYSRVSFGQLKIIYIQRFIDINKYEALILLPLVIGAIWFGLTAGPILEVIGYDTALLVK